MGSYYYFVGKKCPYCEKVCDELIFAENSYDETGELRGYDTSRCEHCGNKIKITM